MVKEPGIRGRWAQQLLGEPERLLPRIPFELVHLLLGDDLAFLTMPGEVAVAYGIDVKRQSGNTTLPLAYANGLIGYIVTAEQLAEGGYEPGESTLYYGLPSPFSPEIEPLLTTTIDCLLHRSAGSRRGQATDR